jgi:hypothetical protein
MGQATVDLPDPLEAPPPSSLSGTDDLLAQLAGDEIDRLLAEADLEQKAPATKGEAPSDPAATPAREASSATPAVTTHAAPVAPVEAAAKREPAAPAAPAPAPTNDVAATAVGGDELDDLLSKLEEGGASSLAARTPIEPPPVAEAPNAAATESTSLVDRVPDILAQFPAAAADATAAAQPNASATADASASPAQVAASTAIPAAIPEDDSDVLMSAAERDALKISELADDGIAAEPAAADDPGPGRLAPLVKLLELLNAPMSFVPDRLRDTLGKVAIVTLVNSIAVLVYVLFLRH